MPNEDFDGTARLSYSSNSKIEIKHEIYGVSETNSSNHTIVV